jgi:formyltetrahydrofolate deformylase
MENRYILRIKCPDQKGLIAGITGVLFRNKLNIVVMKEFVDQETNGFFTRSEFVGDPDTENLQKELQSVLPARAAITINKQRTKDIVVLVTKEHHCLGDLLMRHHFNELHASIKAVIGNHEILKDLTTRFDVPFYHVSHEGMAAEKFEEKILDLIKKYQPDYLVLAKFMRILSPAFVALYNEKIINIHHSFLPAFKGANPYRQAYKRGVKLIGATAHIVNNDLDEGPIITQKIIPVDHEYTAEGMVEAGHEIEKSVLADALKLIFEDRVFVSGNKTIIFD